MLPRQLDRERSVDNLVVELRSAMNPIAVGETLPVIRGDDHGVFSPSIASARFRNSPAK
jgi:hypothetical protein